MKQWEGMTRRTDLFLIIILFSIIHTGWAQGGAASREFIFITEPEAARIRISCDGGEKSEFVGISGAPLGLDLSAMDENRPILFYFEKTNYEVKIISLSPDYLRKNSRYPPEGALHLTSSLREILFLTRPANSKVYIETGDTNNYRYLGESGAIIKLDTASLKHPRIHFQLDGFKEYETALPLERLRTDTLNFFPEDHVAVKLAPEIPVISPFLNWVRRHVLHSVVIVTLAVLLIAEFGIIAPYVRQLRRQQSRMATIERITSQVRHDDIIGRILGKYRIVEKLGSGGMAVVYRAVREGSESEEDSVAIKIIRLKRLDDPDFSQRFKREMVITSALHHPSILRVFDYGDMEGQLYMVMEMVRGKTLQEVIPEHGMTPHAFMEIFKYVLQAMEYAHSREVIHRDLKPDNIMISEDGRVLVTDFGLARKYDKATITTTGTALGTATHMAPEQITSTSHDGRTDQYSLGVVAYQMLTGRLPFWDRNTTHLMLMHINDKPLPIRKSRPDIPEQMENIVLRMLEKEREKRFKNLGEVTLALESALKEMNPDSIA